MAAGDKTIIASELYVDGKVQTDVPSGAVFTDTVYDDSTTTKQGNTFNGVEQLVKTDVDGKLPAIDGSLLTGLIDDGVLATDSTWSSSKTSTGIEEAKQQAVAMAIVFG